jgi:hypothetical protein
MPSSKSDMLKMKPEPSMPSFPQSLSPIVPSQATPPPLQTLKLSSQVEVSSTWQRAPSRLQTQTSQLARGLKAEPSSEQSARSLFLDLASPVVRRPREEGDSTEQAIPKFRSPALPSKTTRRLLEAVCPLSCLQAQTQSVDALSLLQLEVTRSN